MMHLSPQPPTVLEKVRIPGLVKTPTKHYTNQIGQCILLMVPICSSILFAASKYMRRQLLSLGFYMSLIVSLCQHLFIE